MFYKIFRLTFCQTPTKKIFRITFSHYSYYRHKSRPVWKAGIAMPPSWEPPLKVRLKAVINYLCMDAQCSVPYAPASNVSVSRRFFFNTGLIFKKPILEMPNSKKLMILPQTTPIELRNCKHIFHGKITLMAEVLGRIISYLVSLCPFKFKFKPYKPLITFV